MAIDKIAIKKGPTETGAVYDALEVGSNALLVYVLTRPAEKHLN